MCNMSYIQQDMKKNKNEKENEVLLPSELLDDVNVNNLVENIKSSNEAVLEQLKLRFSQDLIANMVFFMFNSFCAEKDGDTINESMKDFFLKNWKKNINKQIKVEMLEINKKFKDEKMNYLGAISNYSMPSTEDYQEIYNKAVKFVSEVYINNVN